VSGESGATGEPRAADESGMVGDRGVDGPAVGLGTVLNGVGRIGCLGFGGPPAHIALLRKRSA
jgi:hypothetical protein